VERAGYAAWLMGGDIEFLPFLRLLSRSSAARAA